MDKKSLDQKPLQLNECECHCRFFSILPPTNPFLFQDFQWSIALKYNLEKQLAIQKH